MMIVLILALIAILLIWIGYIGLDSYSDGFSFLIGFPCGLAGVVILGALVLSLAGVGLTKLLWSDQLARLAEYRAAAESIGEDQSEVLTAEIVEFNARLAGRKVLNGRWWADPFIADEWMSVESVELPKGEGAR